MTTTTNPNSSVVDRSLNHQGVNMTVLRQTERTAVPDRRRLPLRKKPVFSTYNVRTLQVGKWHQLYTGCSADGIDFAGIQEHRLIATAQTEELRNRFANLSIEETSPTTERYSKFEEAVSSAAEKVLGKRLPNGLPTWVSATTENLKKERDETKRRYLVSKSWCQNLSDQLAHSYQQDEVKRLEQRLQDLTKADRNGNSLEQTHLSRQQKIYLSELIPQHCRRLQRPSMVLREIRLHHLTVGYLQKH